METPPELSLLQRLYKEALKLRNESERRLFLAVFAALGVFGSGGCGVLFHYWAVIPFAFIVGTILSSFLVIPLFIYIGIILWDGLNRRRALSSDDFDVLKFLKDDFDRDVREVQALPHTTDATKKILIKERYERYVKERDEVRKRIEEQSKRRRGKYYLGD
jgi:hypothetical protein